MTLWLSLSISHKHAESPLAAARDNPLPPQKLTSPHKTRLNSRHLVLFHLTAPRAQSYYCCSVRRSFGDGLRLYEAVLRSSPGLRQCMCVCQHWPDSADDLRPSGVSLSLSLQRRSTVCLPPKTANCAAGRGRGRGDAATAGQLHIFIENPLLDEEE